MVDLSLLLGISFTCSVQVKEMKKPLYAIEMYPNVLFDQTS